MIHPALLAVGTAVPPHTHSQDDLLAAYTALFPTHRHRLKRVVFEQARIERRHLVIEDLGRYWAEPRSTAERNALYIESSFPLARTAVERALAGADLDPTEIDDLIVVSCTGLDTPGLDLRLAGALGMRPDLRRTIIGSMGCYGAFPALNRAMTTTMARPGSRALILCVELGSIHMQADDSRETLISSALFSDGASAAVLSSHPEDLARDGRPQLIDNETRCDYQTAEEMTFRVTDEGFRMFMSAYVPDVLATNVPALVTPLLERAGLRIDEVEHWAIHPGGARILDYLQESLCLSPHQMAPSNGVLREFGNMSSATILFVLDCLQRHHRPQQGEHGVLLAFGPGLTMEAALLRW